MVLLFKSFTLSSILIPTLLSPFRSLGSLIFSKIMQTLPPHTPYALIQVLLGILWLHLFSEFFFIIYVLFHNSQLHISLNRPIFPPYNILLYVT